MAEMKYNEWNWIGGRLYHPTYPKLNYSVGEAWSMIPTHPGIARACKGVLKPFDKYKCEKTCVDIIAELRQELEARKIL